MLQPGPENQASEVAKSSSQIAAAKVAEFEKSVAPLLEKRLQELSEKSIATSQEEEKAQQERLRKAIQAQIDECKKAIFAVIESQEQPPEVLEVMLGQIKGMVEKDSLKLLETQLKEQELQLEEQKINKTIREIERQKEAFIAKLKEDLEEYLQDEKNAKISQSDKEGSRNLIVQLEIWIKAEMEKGTSEILEHLQSVMQHNPTPEDLQKLLKTYQKTLQDKFATCSKACTDSVNSTKTQLTEKVRASEEKDRLTQEIREELAEAIELRRTIFVMAIKKEYKKHLQSLKDRGIDKATIKILKTYLETHLKDLGKWFDSEMGALISKLAEERMAQGSEKKDPDAQRAAYEKRLKDFTEICLKEEVSNRQKDYKEALEEIITFRESITQKIAACNAQMQESAERYLQEVREGESQDGWKNLGTVEDSVKRYQDAQLELLQAYLKSQTEEQMKAAQDQLLDTALLEKPSEQELEKLTRSLQEDSLLRLRERSKICMQELASYQETLYAVIYFRKRIEDDIGLEEGLKDTLGLARNLAKENLRELEGEMQEAQTHPAIRKSLKEGEKENTKKQQEEIKEALKVKLGSFQDLILSSAIELKKQHPEEDPMRALQGDIKSYEEELQKFLEDLSIKLEKSSKERKAHLSRAINAPTPWETEYEAQSGLFKQENSLSSGALESFGAHKGVIPGYTSHHSTRIESASSIEANISFARVLVYAGYMVYSGVVKALDTMQEQEKDGKSDSKTSLKASDAPPSESARPKPTTSLLKPRGQRLAGSDKLVSRK